MRRRQKWGQAALKPPVSDLKEPDIYEMYELKFGKKPHHRMKRETILRKLEDGNTG